MKCPKCGKDVILQKKQVGVDENGNPVLNDVQKNRLLNRLLL